MTTLLYAVMDLGTSVEGCTAPGGRPLRIVGDDGLGAVVSELDGHLHMDEPSLWAHEHAIEQLMDRGSLLPARFGTTAQDEREILQMLRDRRNELEAALERVRGAVEYAVHVDTGAEPVGASAAGGGTGVAYMRGLLAQRRHERELMERVESQLGDLARAVTVLSSTSLACLVPRERVSEFVARAETYALSISGPWPPYSFVTP